MDKGIAGYILAGGKNRRIGGRKKVLLTYEGQTFYHHIREKLRCVGKTYLSVDEEGPYMELHADLIVDKYPGTGPMGGILSGLMTCREDALFVVPCDMVPFPEGMAQWMLLQYQEKKHPIVPCYGGRLVPFPAIYTKDMLPIVKEQMQQKEYCIKSLWERLEGTYDIVNVEAHGWSLKNVNSIEEYSELAGSRVSVTLEEALSILNASAGKVEDVECLPLLDALGRCAAEDLCAAHDQPPFPRSPLDGYAVAAKDLAHAGRNTPVILNVSGEIMAGGVFSGRLEPGQAVRIMTGAPIPDGADAVVRQEDTDYGESAVSIYQKVDAYQNYCHRGEDFRRGDCLIKEGDRLNASAVTVAASMGFQEVLVKRLPKVAVMSTGNELKMPGEGLGPGQIYNSNQFYAAGRLLDLGIHPVSAGHVDDDVKAVADYIRKVSETAELIITTGGVSVGKKDIMHDVIEELGAKKLFWRVQFKPGSPVIAFMYQKTCVVCLSGNPFGMAVGLEVIIRPLLYNMTGDTHYLPKKVPAVMSDDYPKTSIMRRFLRAVLKDGKVFLPSGQSSGMVSSLKECNCIIDIPAGNSGLKRGESVCVIMI